MVVYRKHVTHRTRKNFQLDLFHPDDGHYATCRGHWMLASQAMQTGDEWASVTGAPRWTARPGYVSHECGIARGWRGAWVTEVPRSPASCARCADPIPKGVLSQATAFAWLRHATQLAKDSKSN